MRYRAEALGTRRQQLCALVLAIGTLGCATAQNGTPKHAPRPLRAATLDEVLSAYDGYCKRLESLNAGGDLDVADAQKGTTRKLSVRFVATRGGKFYLKGSVAVVTALEVVADGEHFWFQVPSKKAVWTGSERSVHQAAAGETAPYTALRPRDVVDAFLPEPMSRDGVLLYEADSDGFSLAQGALRDGKCVVRRRVTLSRENLEPFQLRTYNEQGDLTVEVGLSAFASGTPRRVTIARPVEGYRATFALTKFDTNGPVPERAFVPRIPEGYVVHEVPD
jgi:hypothetical protein